MLTLVRFSLLLFAFQANAQSFIKTMIRLPDTGALTGFTSIYGEDNDFNYNVPLLVAQPNGIVRDSVTGLMWQQTDGGEMTIESAMLYCDTLTLGGFTDWRLPNAQEAYSIMNQEYNNPAIDTNFFTKTTAQYWWTSDRQPNDTNKVWVTNSGGGIGNHPRTETISAGGTKRMHVRAVREVYPSQMLTSRFVNNGDGTTTDFVTGLTWQNIPYTDTLTWEQALIYADTLSLGGQSDWRLPNIKEIHSINSESLHHPSLDSNFFMVVSGQKFWSSTTLHNQPVKAWYMDTQFGITTYDVKTNRHELMCVRGTPMITAVHQVSAAVPLIYPNPFRSYLRIDGLSASEEVIMTDCLGRIRYAGFEIQSQDFSNLTPGTYTLIFCGRGGAYVKVIKY